MLSQPLTETESKLFYQQLIDETGLTVGWRTLKNYSLYVIYPERQKQENPSVATLDTLARYVLHAPVTNELKRKSDESHFPFWFRYKEQNEQPPEPVIQRKPRRISVKLPAISFFLILLIAGSYIILSRRPIHLQENFRNITNSYLTSRGWQIRHLDSAYWNRRSENAGALTLFTLPGDNWPDSGMKPMITNLLIHSLPGDCFNAELHIEDFIPAAEWQQAGLLLMDDTSLEKRNVRISIAFNDYFAGYKKSGEILIQAIAVPSNEGKPEEFAHSRILLSDSLVKNEFDRSFEHSSLRIEKTGNICRFLFSGGQRSNSAFKEIASQQINFKPRFIGIFALKGAVSNTPIAPVKIKTFMLDERACP